MRSKVLLSLFAASGLLGCASADPCRDSPAASGCDAPSGLSADLSGEHACEPLDEQVVEHACLHGQFGPVKEVAAQPAGEPVTTSVNTPHTRWNITLPGATGSVLFTPTKTADHVFFQTSNYGLKIFEGTSEIEVECSYEIEATVCSALPGARVVELVAGQTYRLELSVLNGAASDGGSTTSDAGAPVGGGVASADAGSSSQVDAGTVHADAGTGTCADSDSAAVLGLVIERLEAHEH